MREAPPGPLAVLHVFERGGYLLARRVEQYLQERGVDAWLVTRHAVKVPATQQARAVELLKDFAAWEETLPGAAIVKEVTNGEDTV